uniref:Integrase catalytic domain-containing protein n=1 Tax=Panagrolaimus davidi TaxID=227884 RepID=A0A914PDL9_9BILA
MDKKLIAEAHELFEERVNFKIKLKRLMFSDFPASGVEMHVFADSSAQAYGIAVYFRYKDKHGKYQVILVFSKSRLTSLKPVLTIVKNELNGVALAGQVVQYILEVFENLLIFTRVVIHSDSSPVLNWLNDPTGAGRYVINRVKKLKELINVEFRHVPGLQNPADLVTRGCSPSEFLTKKSWFNGPEFLSKSEEFWPKQPTIRQLKEEVKLIAALRVVKDVHIDRIPPMIDARKYPSWRRLISCTVKVLKFVSSITKKFPAIRKRIFGTSEVDQILLQKLAEKLILMQIQHTNEVEAGKVHALDLYNDEGIWRKYSRINGESDPIYLTDSPATQLLILNIHHELNHTGVSTVLAQINQVYFLPKARSLIKTVLRKRCMRCRRFKALPFALPVMKDLPKVRTFGHPYESVGIDLCGPFSIKLQQDIVSSWVVVFTCLVTRAVHLELVMSLSGEAFIDALTRFAARRGMPSFIYSDNGTNLKVASLTVIPKWISKEDPDVMDYCTSKKITWKFVTEKTPWAGGVYESMVKLVKRNIKFAAGKKQFVFSKFVTFLCQAEAFINCRPLTYVADDCHQVIIRPIDFTTPFIKPGLPHIHTDKNDPDFSTGTNHETLVSLWLDLQTRLNKFKNLFVSDYLAFIRDRSRHHHQSGHVVPRAPRVGEVVTIFEDNYDAVYWKLGKIVEVIESKDGRSRTAKVLTANGHVLNRPVNHLYPLEIDDDSMKAITQAVKASSLKQLYRQAPIAFKHADSSENASVEVKEDPPPKKTHRMVTRGDTSKASVSSVFHLNPVILLLCCLIACITGITAERCMKNISLEKVYKSACFEQKYAVYKKEVGYCWRESDCSKLTWKDIRTHPFCDIGESCTCPDWSFGCSIDSANHTSNNSTMKHSRVRTTLTLMKPLVCSYESSKHCSDKPAHQEHNQVQLLDNTLHLVEEMHIVHHQIHDESFKCFGEGKEGFDGPPEYCSIHTCNPKADAVCVPTFQEKHFLRTPHGNVEIKAWGIVQKMVYLKKELPPPDLVTKCEEGILTVEGFGTDDVLQIDYTKSTNFVKPKDKILLHPLPRKLLVFDHNITITCWRKGVKTVTATQLCSRQDFCKHIHCIFCPELFANFTCISIFWWISAFLFCLVMILVGIELYYLLCKKKRGDRAVLLRKLFQLLPRLQMNKKEVMPEDIELTELQSPPTEEIEETTHSRNSSPTSPLRYNNTLAISVAILSLLIGVASASSQVISYQAENRFCVQTAQGIKRCEHNHVAHFTVKDQNFIEMIFEDEQSHPQATLTLKINPTATCLKAHSSYTRLVKIKVYSSQRCPGAGSCIDNICENTVANTSIPELALVNDKPGISRCASSCACWGCGCFKCTESCTFYRYYVEPVNHLIYEEFQCRRWIFGADIELVQRTNHKTDTHKFHLDEGFSQEYEHFQISLPSVRTSDIVTFKSFLFDGERLSLSSDASSNAMKLFSCYNHFDAERAACKLSDEACNCLPAGEGVNCQCKNNEILKNELDASSFPNEQAHFQFNQSQVFYLLQNSVTDIIVATKNFEVVTQLDYNACHYMNSSIQGCANCNNGALMLLQCQSDFGMSLASVKCGVFVFSILCDANYHMITIDLNTTNVFLNCTLICPANNETFIVKGTLHFINDDPSTPEKDKATSKVTC